MMKMKQGHRVAVTQSPYLDGVTDSVLCDLDATIAASYPGTGVTWANLIAAPADGSAQTAYDFYRGDGSTSTTYPTFTGTAGDAAAYFAHDGGDYFRLKSGTNTPFLRDMHKTTGGSDFWIAAAFYTPAADSNIDGIMNTQLNATNPGFRFVHSASETISLIQRGASNASNSGTAVLAGNAAHLVIVSHSHAQNKTRHWADSVTAEELDHSFNATTTDASSVTYLAAALGTTNLMGNGGRFYSLAFGNAYLDNARAAAIIAHLEARHGRDYTP